VLAVELQVHVFRHELDFGADVLGLQDGHDFEVVEPDDLLGKLRVVLLAVADEPLYHFGSVGVCRGFANETFAFALDFSE
jgi:hypothetical protein